MSYAKVIKNVKFWKSAERGFYLSHNKGLTQEQVEFLRSLEPGDKLIIFAEKDPTGREVLTLKKSNLIATVDAPTGSPVA